jgi:hypothetical protein
VTAHLGEPPPSGQHAYEHNSLEYYLLKYYITACMSEEFDIEVVQ